MERERRSYNRPEDIRRVLQELEEDEQDDISEENQPVGDFDDPDDIDFEYQQINNANHNSDSEQDAESGDEDDPDDDSQRFYIGKDGETLWSNKPIITQNSRTRSKKFLKIFPGPCKAARQCKTASDCFFLIMTLDIIDEIVTCTNIYITRKREQHPTSRAKDFKTTDRAEILALFGALFLLAVKKANKANMSAFFTNDGTGITILKANFGEHRFRFLLGSLRFDDINTRLERMTNDKLAPVRQFLIKFVQNCQRAYNLGEFTTIDEMLVAFRGRCSFLQYMAQKPAKYGIKIYALCDARTFYTYNLEIYCGAQHPGPYATSNKPFDVVKRLSEPIKNSNRNLTMDNYYSSYPLAEHLFQNKIRFLGTLKKTKRQIPREFVIKNEHQVPGSYTFGAQYDKTMVSMITRKKKVVLVLSTMHDRDEIDLETGKPIQIMDYNATKGAVDIVDLMCSGCSTSRFTQRWPMAIFFRLLDVAGINAYKIFRANNVYNTTKRRKFVFKLSMELMEENLKVRAQLWCLPRELQVFLENFKEKPSATNQQATTSNQRPICYCCGSKRNNRTRLMCNKCKKYICKNHSQQDVTCNPCFELCDKGMNSMEE